MTTNAYRDGKVHVQSVKCPTCIFRPGNLMQLKDGRVEGMVADCIRDQGVVRCHDTTGRRPKRESVCRGFWDLHRRDVGLLQVAERLGLVEYN